MLKTLARIFGLDTPPPPPPPKRRPSARKAKQLAPVAPPAPATPTVPTPIALPGFAIAVRTFIRQWGQYGTVPDQPRLDAAAYVLGRDFTAFLTALHLVDGRLTRFLVPDDRITDPASIAGLREKLADAMLADLDVWTEAEKVDLRNRTIARQAGRPVPTPLHVPDAVREALMQRMKDSAARVARGGQGGRGGGVRPAPPEAMGAPEPIMIDAEGGGRSRVAGAAEEPDEAAPAEEGAAPAPRIGGGSSRRRKDDDEVEETATGIHVPPPSPEDGEPEGGGPGLPRV